MMHPQVIQFIVRNSSVGSQVLVLLYGNLTFMTCCN